VVAPTILSLIAVLLAVHDAPPWSHGTLQRTRVSRVAETAFAQLDSPVFQERQAGSRSLLLPSVAEAEVLALLSRRGLSTEQHVRLLGAAEIRIRESPRAALGIQMAEPSDGQRGVVVTGVQRGSPASGVLKIHDRIVEVNSSPVGTRADVMNDVQSQRPGDRVTLAVLRGDARVRLHFELPLGTQYAVAKSGVGVTEMSFSDGSRERLALQLREAFPLRTARLPAQICQ
jgi:hypothetical protein